MLTSLSSSNLPDIDFPSIRPFQGKRDKGFEELCVQLLPLIVEDQIKQLDRIEGSGGDGGIEAVAVTANNKHIGIQAKHIDKLGTSQWKQIDKSVQAAIKNHPELGRYIVCVTLDRTPAAIKKWNKFKAAWLLAAPSLSVEWCGAFELRGYLIRASASHHLTYWFGCPEFSLEWVGRQTELAIEQLHHRYTPKLHQATLTEQDLEFILALQSACKKHRAQCSELVIAWRTVLENIPNATKKLDTTQTGMEVIEPLRQTIAVINDTVADGDITRQGENLITALNDVNSTKEKLVSIPRQSRGL